MVCIKCQHVQCLIYIVKFVLLNHHPNMFDKLLFEINLFHPVSTHTFHPTSQIHSPSPLHHRPSHSSRHLVPPADPPAAPPAPHPLHLGHLRNPRVAVARRVAPAWRRSLPKIRQWRMIGYMCLGYYVYEFAKSYVIHVFYKWKSVHVQFKELPVIWKCGKITLTLRFIQIVHQGQSFIWLKYISKVWYHEPRY